MAFLRLIAAALLAPRALLAAQAAPAGTEHPARVTWGARVIPLVTHATATPAGRALTEAYLSQPTVMVAAAVGPLDARGTLDLEGLTLRRGELLPGAWGEGYVDRRHPHAYLHELMVGASTGASNARVSVFGGRGYVPFGSDDPMLRPFVAFPVNHHLAQILERFVVVTAVGVGPLTGEASLFNGDEPLDPATPPLLRRFGDSWSARLTIKGSGFADVLSDIEISASHAAVKSPEYREGRGLDQRKNHVGLRYAGGASTLPRYALIEWARTTDLDHGREVYRFSSVLAEAAVCVADAGAALRLERSSRPEEERLLDPFRAPRPAVDNSIVGVTRWTMATASFSFPALTLGVVRGSPFIEAAQVAVRRASAGAFDPTLLYGSSPGWRISTGLRVVAGSEHARMGRYGVAELDHPREMDMTPSSTHATQHRTHCFP